MLVRLQGWEGLYVNGVLTTEGKSLTAADALASLGLQHYIHRDESVACTSLPNTL